MTKTLEQIIMEGLAADCTSFEELFVLWQTMQQMEECPVPSTCYQEIDPRSFHVDGVMNPQEFSGVLYILKEPSLKKYIQKGMTFPVICDIRREYQKYGKGFDDECGYLAGMQRMLLGERAEKMGSRQVMDTMAVLYVNKRGGREVSDEVYLNYGKEYMQFIKREIQLIDPKVIVCCGEEIFRLTAKEIFSNKKKIRGRGEQMVWKNVVKNDQFTADEHYRFTDSPEKAERVVIHMWDPAYPMYKDRHIRPEAYLQEFHKRITGVESV